MNKGVTRRVTKGQTHALALGMKVTLDEKGVAINHGGLFQALGAQEYLRLGATADVDSAARSGAGEALVVFVRELAQRGIVVWGAEFKEALDSAVETLEMELR